MCTVCYWQVITREKYYVLKASEGSRQHLRSIRTATALFSLASIIPRFFLSSRLIDMMTLLLPGVIQQTTFSVFHLPEYVLAPRSTLPLCFSHSLSFPFQTLLPPCRPGGKRGQFRH